MEDDAPSKWQSKESGWSFTHNRKNTLQDKKWQRWTLYHDKGAKMQQENILFIINIYAPNIKALKYKKQILTDLKRENDSSTVIRGDLNTIFRSVDGISRQKVNKVT